VCLINYGPDAGRLCTIVDIVDQNKCLVEGPRALTGVSRQIMPFKRLALTDLVCKVAKNADQKAVAEAFKVTTERFDSLPARACVRGFRSA
jgi:large subunit ribosomal protein L14e